MLSFPPFAGRSVSGFHPCGGCRQAQRERALLTGLDGDQRNARPKQRCMHVPRIMPNGDSDRRWHAVAYIEDHHPYVMESQKILMTQNQIDEIVGDIFAVSSCSKVWPSTKRNVACSILLSIFALFSMISDYMELPRKRMHSLFEHFSRNSRRI